MEHFHIDGALQRYQSFDKLFALLDTNLFAKFNLIICTFRVY